MADEDQIPRALRAGRRGAVLAARALAARERPGLAQLWRDLFANRISSFFGLDVIVSAIVVLALIHDERRRRGLPRAWPVAATLLIGVSAGLPLFVYMRREE